MSGVSILSSFKELGYEVKAYSYLQGVKALSRHNIDLIMCEQPDTYHITSIGLNPVCRTSEKLIKLICQESPDLVIVDGEPLFTSTLVSVYPRNKVVSLLNPADLYNPANPVSSMNFFCKHYLSAGSAVVHGIDKDSIIIPKDTCGCNVIKTNTILRKDVLETVTKEKTNVVCILGGGSSNSSENFWNSTIEMAKRILETARCLINETFIIYCNDDTVAKAIKSISLPKNVRILSEYALPQEMYDTAKIILCRAGRNTISEILYLNIPAILMSSNGDFRSSEQNENIKKACSIRQGRLLEACNDETGDMLAEKIMSAINTENSTIHYNPGNVETMDYLLKLLK